MTKQMLLEQVVHHKSWRRPAQLLATIGLTFLTGAILETIPVFARTLVFDTLTAADLVAFGTKLAALVLFFILCRESISSIPDDGRALTFIRGIAVPVATLVIIVLGYSMLSGILQPFIWRAAEKMLDLIALAAILASGIWIVLRGYRYSPQLVDALWNLTSRFKGKIPASAPACPDCGAPVHVDMKYCATCGCALADMQCPHCGSPMTPAEKFCGHCGKPRSE